LIESEAAANKAVKEARYALDTKVLAQYAKVSEAEIKTLVVDTKWMIAIQATIDSEVHCLTRGLARRIKELEERYAVTLSDLKQDADELSGKVAASLKKMGLVLV
jgi:type I restriction enzyme M protein